MEAILSSFALVAASEMGDKTQLLAFSLASRFRKPWHVMAGILVATLANHALASSVGAWVSAHVPERMMAGILAVTFVVFGLWTLKPDTMEESTGSNSFGPFLTTTVLFFLAEMGDKTQLATVALAARYHYMVLVTAGTTVGMLVSDGLAVWLGERMSGRVQARWVRVTAACLFFIFGALSAWRALR
ncbi:Putative Ca2+/H+ antiporter, TMEM165/GDT1 family [Stigmatella aurantiaca]|uniref:GDT1 family protein n=1 Tax=Stigmatella aurantiaca TaxID=41 RepID=A0A1H7Q7N5_STIAU|nr:TMEM165/GDT1 family protein [Stigmatella aurantiaca]SEL44002.1 Putative Ca2+/H+ antiporter, TMEM165/GDT1 family [Stigmatella aurantiaca]